MSLVKSEFVLNPVEYVEKLFPDNHFKPTEVHKMMTISEMRNFLDKHNLSHLWDFPLSEISDIVGNDNPVVLVCFDTGHAKMYRWFELTEECC